MKKLIKTIKHLYDRARSKTPYFWRKIQGLAISVGGSAVAVLVANGQLALDLPDSLITIEKYVIAVCVAIAGTAQLTKEDQTNA